MFKYVVVFLGIVSVISICAPDAFIEFVKALSSMFRDLGFTSIDDIYDSVNTLKNEVF